MKERVQAVVAWGTRLGLEYTRTRASLAAGGLAYFVALSLAPAALAFGTLAGLFLDPADVRAVLERLAERAPGDRGQPAARRSTRSSRRRERVGERLHRDDPRQRC